MNRIKQGHIFLETILRVGLAPHLSLPQLLLVKVAAGPGYRIYEQVSELAPGRVRVEFEYGMKGVANGVDESSAFNGDKVIKM